MLLRYGLRLFSLLPRWRFERALQRPLQSQNGILASIMKQLATTELGEKYGIAGNETYSEFQKKVPLHNYEDLAPWILRQCREPNTPVLMKSPPLRCEITSGSSGSNKLIPYNATLISSFRHMFVLWLGDILSHGPTLKTAKTYIMISPQSQRRPSSEIAIPIGTQDDREYLGWLMRALLGYFFVGLESVQKLSAGSEDFYDNLALILLQSEDLEVISIWNPTFLVRLIEHIKANWEHQLSRKIKVKKSRYDTISHAIEQQNYAMLWPQLKLISMWTQAYAAGPTVQVSKLFPKVLIQPKGLLATEVPCTLPWRRASDQGVPLLESVYFEFLMPDGVFKTLAELRLGDKAELICSHQSGLYRYRLGDLVEVTSFYRKTPCFSFLGRAGQLCDLVGEKLNEQFIHSSIQPLLDDSESFYVVVPLNENNPHYCFVFDNAQKSQRLNVGAIDSNLRRSHHFNLARDLKQLAVSDVRFVAGLEQAYLDFKLSKGLSHGDIKLKRLETNSDLGAQLLQYLDNRDCG